MPKATHKRIKDAVRRYCDVTAMLVFLSLLEAYLSQTNQLARARAVDGRARWLFRLAYLALVLKSLYFRFGF